MKKLLLLLFLIPNLVMAELPRIAPTDIDPAFALPALEGDELSWKEKQQKAKRFEDAQRKLRELRQQPKKNITDKSYINSLKRECNLLGFSSGTKKFKNCVVELM